MILSNFKHSRHQQYLEKLPKIPQEAVNIKTIYSPQDFYNELICTISRARQRICLVSLYLEQDHGGQNILEAVYEAKRHYPFLDVVVLVDWHRAQRGRIGGFSFDTNADWYSRMTQTYPGIDVPVYGVPVNTREVLGVLHLKGFIIDSQVIYSGASLNNAYLHQWDKYRYDRYHIIYNLSLADTLLTYIKQNLIASPSVNRLDQAVRPKIIEVKNNAPVLRKALRKANYLYLDRAGLNELGITPMVGLGRRSQLNTTIRHLLCSTCNNLIICTPYFNLSSWLVRDLINLLRIGRRVEIIVGDKTANDFYIPQDHPFKIIGTLPYLYEINLRVFLSYLSQYVDNGQLVVRLWQDADNSYHVKGVWVDNKWQLLTGHNLNPRAWNLDLENALLIHDPLQELHLQREKELKQIRVHTQVLRHFTELENISDYPIKVRKIIRRIRRIRIDTLIRQFI